MLDIGCFSSVYAQCRLLLFAFKNLWAKDYAAKTVYISNLKSNNDYVVRLIKRVFHIILVFLDALRTPNYSLDELLIKLCKMQSCLHKHLFYVYKTDFAMKLGQSAYAVTCLNAVKIACNLAML